MPPLAIVAGAAIVAGTATSIITGSKAAKAQEKASQAATDVQLRLFDKAAALVEPFRKGGLGALDLLQDIFVGGDTSKILEMPGISFLREQGEQAIGRAQSARGNFLSGPAIKEAIRFNQGLASTNLAQATNPLFALTTIGANAAAFTGNAAVQTGAGVAGTILAGGNAQAAGFANIGSSINTGINNALFMGMLQSGAFTSARDLKENFTDVEPVLDKVRSLKVEGWNYKSKTGLDNEKHIGPMAADFKERFGGSDRHIDMLTANGVLLKAVQELADKIEQLEAA